MSAPPVQFVGRRLVAAAVTAVAAFASLAAVPASAPAALRWQACPGEAGFECAVLRVPLDRSGAVPGTVPLHITRERRKVRGGRVYVSLLGGPGQGGDAVRCKCCNHRSADAIHRHLKKVIFHPHFGGTARHAGSSLVGRVEGRFCSRFSMDASVRSPL